MCSFDDPAGKIEVSFDQAEGSVLLRPIFALLLRACSPRMTRVFSVTEDRLVSFFFAARASTWARVLLQDMVPSTGVDASCGVSQTTC